MAERTSSAATAADRPRTSEGGDPSSSAAANVYANTSARPRHCRMCGRAIPPPAPGTPGQRARYCETCKQVREALRYARASVRRLEAIVPPDHRLERS